MGAFVTAKAAIGKLYEVIGRVPLIDGLSTTGLNPSQKCSGQIDLKNLQFSYPLRPDVLACKNVNLNIKTGETVAFVGASGSGKVRTLRFCFAVDDFLV